MTNDADITTLVTDWNKIVATKVETDAQEIVAREKVVTACFGRVKAGTNRRDIGYGYDLRAYVPENYTIRKSAAGDYAYIPNILAQLPQAVWTTLIKWKAELNKEVYDTLTEEEKLIANQFITMQLGSPQVQIVRSKETAG